jgi:hypothetical protein
MPSLYTFFPQSPVLGGQHAEFCGGGFGKGGEERREDVLFWARRVHFSAIGIVMIRSRTEKLLFRHTKVSLAQGLFQARGAAMCRKDLARDAWRNARSSIDFEKHRLRGKYLEP